MVDDDETANDDGAVVVEVDGRRLYIGPPHEPGKVGLGMTYYGCKADPDNEEVLGRLLAGIPLEKRTHLIDGTIVLPEPPSEMYELRRENALLREELLDQWEANHFEHCSREWPHPAGKMCMWPLPQMLESPPPAP